MRNSEYILVYNHFFLNSRSIPDLPVSEMIFQAFLGFPVVLRTLPKEDNVNCAECVSFPAKVIRLAPNLKSSDHKTAATRARDYLKVCNKEQHN